MVDQKHNYQLEWPYRGNINPLLKDRYTLIEQSGNYSNRVVTYTLIEHASLVELFRNSNINGKLHEHDLLTLYCYSFGV